MFAGSRICETFNNHGTREHRVGMGGLKSYKVVTKSCDLKRRTFLVLLGDGGDQFPSAELGEPVNGGFVGFSCEGGFPEVDFFHCFYFLSCFLSVL